MKQIITRDNRGNLVSWYGFEASETASQEPCYLTFFEGFSMADLHLDDNTVEIDFSSLVAENTSERKIIHTENDICNFIYNACREHEKDRKIYVNPDEVEELSLAGGLENFLTPAEFAVESYFTEKYSQDVYWY